MNQRKSLLYAIAIVVALVVVGEAYAGEPCCSITAVNLKSGVVTAKETATGRAFKFQVKDARLLKSLKVGQKISADLEAMTVTLSAARPGALGAKAVQVRILKAEPVGATGQAMQAAPGSLGGGRRTKIATPRGEESKEKACKEGGGEWRCTVVSTGSSPGPEDDVVSCHCIYSGKPPGL